MRKKADASETSRFPQVHGPSSHVVGRPALARNIGRVALSSDRRNSTLCRFIYASVDSCTRNNGCNPAIGRGSSADGWHSGHDRSVSFGSERGFHLRREGGGGDVAYL